MIVQGFRSWRDIHAYTTFGLPGCTSTSIAPSVSDRYSTFFHVAPPSIVLKMPRSLLALKMSPVDENQTIVGLVGSTRTAPICPALKRTVNFHVAPPSVVL